MPLAAAGAPLLGVRGTTNGTTPTGAARIGSLLPGPMRCVLSLFLALATPAQASLLDDIPAGTGYTAFDMCTRAFVTGQPRARVRRGYIAPEVQPLPWVWSIAIGRDTVSVVSRLPGFAGRRVALFRPGLGCTIVPPGTSIAAVRAQPFTRNPSPPPSAASWPAGEGAAELSADHARLTAIADRVFGETPTSPGETTDTVAFLVARDGHLVYERYGPGTTRDQPQLGWSLTKSLTALVAGLFVGDGRIALDDAVGLPAWEGTAAARITWRSLLTMTAGLDWTEDYGERSDVTEQLFSQADQGGWSAARRPLSRPGTTFNYATGMPTVAMLRMRQLLAGDSQALYDLYQHRLFVPLGIRDGVIAPDATGTPAGGSNGVLRPTDWLRLGQLVVDRGQWAGQQLIPASYIDFMLQPTPADAGYGGYVWFPAALSIPADVRADLPADTFIFWGHLGQFVIGSPSARLVLLRIGVTHYDDEAPLRVLLPAFAELAAPARPPSDQK